MGNSSQVFWQIPFIYLRYDHGVKFRLMDSVFQGIQFECRKYSINTINCYAISDKFGAS